MPKDDRTQLLLEAETAQRNGQHAQVISCSQKVLANNPSRTEAARALHLLGCSLEGLGRDSEAFKAYRSALSLDPGSAELHVSVGKLLLAHGDPPSAIAAFKTALEIQPHSAIVHVYLAQALVSVNAEDEAQRHLEEAITLAPHLSEPHAMLGYRLQTRGMFKEAREQFFKSIELQPQQAISYYGITQGSLITTKDEKLVDQMQAVAKEGRLEPHDQMYLLFSIGKAQGDLGEYESSMRSFDEANRIAFRVCLGGRPFKRHRYEEIIDGTIKTFTPSLFEEHRNLGSPSAQPIFIVGMMRSGTTLVDQIVSSHPQVAAMGERDFWLTQQIKGLDPETMTRVQSAYLDLLRSTAKGEGRVTDKTPQNFQVLGVMHMMFPESPIIHIRRHPIDNCLSIYTTPYDVSPDFAHDQASIAFAYKMYQRLMAHWRTVLPSNRLLEIDYEQLVANHEQTVRRIIEFCGLDWADACLRHESNANTVLTPSLWQVRQPIYGSSVGKWRSYEPFLGEILGFS